MLNCFTPALIFKLIYHIFDNKAKLVSSREGSDILMNKKRMY